MNRVIFTLKASPRFPNEQGDISFTHNKASPRVPYKQGDFIYITFKLLLLVWSMKLHPGSCEQGDLLEIYLCIYTSRLLNTRPHPRSCFSTVIFTCMQLLHFYLQALAVTVEQKNPPVLRVNRAIFTSYATLLHFCL